MQSDLLKKEDEFYKENEKLEQRTKELMKKVNDVMRFASTEDSKNEDLNIPSSVNGMGKKGVIHFYRAKIKSLQEENSNLHTESRKRGEEVKKLQKENQNILEEKDKWFSSYNTVKNTVGKLETQLSSLNSKLQSKDNEMTSVRKEIEQIKKELKNSNLNLNSSEVRLNRAYEENEKLKTTIKSMKEEEKELKESYKKQINDLAATVKRIEQHKTELLNGFKKQLQLIDNLKRQKMYLEAQKVAELSECEYLKILDCKFD
ncbi:testis-expressed protein 9 [Anoplophora glabripennis]|uniref:testis-expressed protein 9 n=1 Tax=Anoplophora glabripennis TaxID=217634 RepID=UPI00087527DA|nr:testis-expressed protein 9 [Anoplophora glabripennis]